MGKNQCAKRDITFRLLELHTTPKLAPIQKILVSTCLDNCPYWECISKCKQGTKQIGEIREFYIVGPYGSSATGEKLEIWRETVYFTGEYPTMFRRLWVTSRGGYRVSSDSCYPSLPYGGWTEY